MILQLTSTRCWRVRCKQHGMLLWVRQPKVSSTLKTCFKLINDSRVLPKRTPCPSIRCWMSWRCCFSWREATQVWNLDPSVRLKTCFDTVILSPKPSIWQKTCSDMWSSASTLSVWLKTYSPALTISPWYLLSHWKSVLTQDPHCWLPVYCWKPVLAQQSLGLALSMWLKTYSPTLISSLEDISCHRSMNRKCISRSECILIRC